MNTCQAPGCRRRVAGYSRLCSAHAKRKRRHGHPEQQGIDRRRLAPHLDLVRRYIDRHGGETLWAKLEALVATARKEAGGIVAEAQSGRPFLRPRAQAAAEFVRVADTASHRAIVEAVAAMAVLWEREPGAFRSDTSAWVQTARRVRNLSDVTKQRYVALGRGGTALVMRDLRLDVSLVLGRMLHEWFANVGTRILQGVEIEHRKRAETYSEVYAALRPSEAA